MKVAVVDAAVNVLRRLQRMSKVTIEHAELSRAKGARILIRVNPDTTTRDRFVRVDLTPGRGSNRCEFEITYDGSFYKGRSEAEFKSYLQLALS